ncbi:MAG TPA: glycosyltransferase family 2 protein [Candidatus Humimicrobiaceae bacterium]|nr:glycosyltransferase family 2 protein [Candidatus Humimicrobiaceae bacterium]
MENSVAVVVPAHNEEQVIANTLSAILKLVDRKDLYVLDDGSTDETGNIAKIYTNNVLSLPNRGKARALNFGIKHFNLTKKYPFIFFMDADTQPSEDFLDRALCHFNEDTTNEIICVVGRVKALGSNWISKYRQWEYQISHLIHKKAQSTLKSIIVVPGCATVYRSFIFDRIEFPTGTLTEDMDFTFTMHRMGFSKMIFEEKAIVYTQDPNNLRDFTKQLIRWYSGFWQVVRKHNIPWQGQALDIEVAMLATEGLYNGLLVILFMFSVIPLATLDRLSIFNIPLAVDFFLFFLPTVIWSSVSDKDYRRILFIPHFYFLRFLSCLVFFVSFFRGFLSIEKEYIWDSKRYVLERKAI